MRSRVSQTWKPVAYIIGGTLLLIGAVRFIERGDMVGVVIFTLSGVLAISLGVTRISRLGANAG